MDLFTDDSTTREFAQKRKRVFAALVDFVILMTGCFLIAKWSGQTYEENGTIGFNLTGLPALVALLFAFLLLPVTEGLTGRTIGKKLFGIEVVKYDFTRVSLGMSIVRHLFDPIDCFFLIGLIVASTNPNKQRIGDLVAKTYVVSSLQQIAKAEVNG